MWQLLSNYSLYNNNILGRYSSSDLGFLHETCDSCKLKRALQGMHERPHKPGLESEWLVI